MKLSEQEGGVVVFMLRVMGGGWERELVVEQEGGTKPKSLVTNPRSPGKKPRDPRDQT